MEFPNGVTEQQVARSVSNRRMELTILPTEKCNFRCTYCYEDFAIGRMSAVNQRGVVNLIRSRASELKELQINWFGGEPLLAKSVIINISKEACRIADEHDFDFWGGLTTNGYALDTETLTDLVAVRQNFFQITLDGWQNGHDATRKRADGEGTFSKIWRNLLAARSTDAKFEIVLRIHITDANIESLIDLAKKIREEFSGDQRFRWDFQDVRNLGGAGSANVVAVSGHEFKAIANHLGSIIENRLDYEAATYQRQLIDPDEIEPIRSESSGSRRSYEILGGEPYICYASRPNHLLIRADGTLGKCTVALNDPVNAIGRLHETGLIDINQNLIRGWSNGFEDFDLTALGCPLTRIHSWLRTDNEKSIKLSLT